MKKIMLVILVIGGVALASIYFYINMKVTGIVDDVIEAARPFATITYKGIENPMDGSVAVSGVSITSPQLFSGIQIETIRFAVPDVLTLLNIKDIARKGEIPEMTRIEINHTRMEMEPVIMMMEGAKRGSDSIWNLIAAQGCGDLEQWSPRYLKELGYDEFDASLVTTFKYNKPMNRISVEGGVTWHDMNSYTTRFEIKNVRKYSDALNVTQEFPGFEFEIEDDGFNQRYIDFCAQKAGVEPQQYIPQHVAKVRALLERAKVSLSEEMYSAYEEYFNRKGPLVISIRPEDKVGFEYLELYKPSDWPAILGLAASVGDHEIQDLSMNWNKDTVVADISRAAQSGEAAINDMEKPGQMRPSAGDGQSEAEKAAPARPSYVATDPKQLGEYVDKYILLLTKMEKKYEGRLLEYSRDNILVKIKMGSGHADIPIRLSDIKEVKVLLYR